MSLYNTLTDAVVARITGDTGTDGLNNLSSAAYVRHVGGDNDPNTDPQRTTNWPNVQVQVVSEDPADAFGTRRGAQVLVRVHVWTRRDNGDDDPGAVAARLRLRLDAWTPSPANGFSFTPFCRVREIAGPATGNTMHRVIEAQTTASTTV